MCDLQLERAYLGFKAVGSAMMVVGMWVGCVRSGEWWGRKYPLDLVVKHAERAARSILCVVEATKEEMNKSEATLLSKWCAATYKRIGKRMLSPHYTDSLVRLGKD